MSTHKGSSLTWTTDDANKFSEDLFNREETYWGENIAEEDQNGSTLKAWRKLNV